MDRVKRKLALLVAFVALSSACSGDDDDDDGVSRATCDALAEVAGQCYDSICTGNNAQTPFCRCWLANQDLNTGSCQCGPLDWSAGCSLLPATTTPERVRSGFNCQAASNVVLGVCVTP